MPAIAARTLCTTALETDRCGVSGAAYPCGDGHAGTPDAQHDAGRLEYRKAPDLYAAQDSPGAGAWPWHVHLGHQRRQPADIPREPPVRLELCLLTVDDTTPGLEWPLTILAQTAVRSGRVYQSPGEFVPDLCLPGTVAACGDPAHLARADAALHAATPALDGAQPLRVL